MVLARMMHHLLLLAATLIVGGCAQCRLPAFDPTGEHFFSGGYTTVSPPDCQAAFPKPAFANAPVAPPAPGPGGAPLCGAKQGAICPAAQMRDRSYVVMMPGRVVAPVGSEVIVVSGICGTNGGYVMRQPLEWMLAPDSVGHIVQVGNNKHHFLTDWLHTASAKIDNEYAKSRTRTYRDTITRGNLNPADDVALGKGQSWVSVMSPTEGASHVTVLAPTEENWDHRRQTATIYWVDAQWTLPSPTIVRIDRREPAILTTHLARAQNIGPIEGWIVRYEALDGPVALFENGQRVIEVPSDLNGNATAHLTPQTPETGITQVGVQIIRPASRSGDYPRMVVGQGLTSAAWSAPGLVVRPIGPATAEADQPVQYRIEVANTGDVVASDVLVTYKIPEGCTVVSSNPPPQPFGDRLEWRLGDIPPKQAPRVIDLTVAMRLQARYEHCFRAMSMRGGQPSDLQANGCVSTIVNRSALVISMTGPQTAPVGSEVKFLATIENTSSLPATNITVKDTFDPGLQHVKGAPSPITISNLGTLGPGERTGVMLTFIVRQPGTLCHRLEATADGGVHASTQGCVIATAGQPVSRLDVRMTGPNTLKSGEEGSFVIEVRNNGTTEVNNLRITNRYSASLFPRQASAKFQLSPGEVYWEWPALAAGDAVSFELRAIARRIDPNAVSVGIVSAEPGMVQQAQVQTRIVDEGGAAVPNDNAAVPPADGQRGGLKLEIVDTEDPVIAGRTFTYQIGVTNTLDVADKNIVLSFELPPGLVYEKLLSRAPVEVRAQGKEYVLSPISDLRGRETYSPFELRVHAEKAGKYQITVRARSARQTEPIVESETTDVLQQ